MGSLPAEDGRGVCQVAMERGMLSLCQVCRLNLGDLALEMKSILELERSFPTSSVVARIYDAILAFNIL